MENHPVPSVKPVERTVTRSGGGAAEVLAKGAAIGAVAVAVDYFTDGEIGTMRDYFRALYRREGHVPEAYSAKGLPPGIQKNLARGKPLPPGIAKRYPPDDLLVRLPPRPGYERVIVGNDVLLVAAATGVILDVLVDVFDGA
jgi:hypothetical protein